MITQVAPWPCMVCVFAGDTKLCAFLVVAEGSLCFLMNSDDFWLPIRQRWICMSIIQCEKNDVKIMSNQHSNKCQLSTSWTKSLSRMCAQWKWNHVSHWIISSIESLVYHCGSRQEWECLNVCFAWLWKKWEDFHLETQHEVTSHLSLMLFPEAMWSAGHNHIPHTVGLALTIWGGHCFHATFLIHGPGMVKGKGCHIC